jgi:DNA-binding beta-propeller fold protein YncE
MNARRLISMASCALVGVLVLGCVPVLAASRGVVGFFGGTGVTGGLFSAPGGVAVNETSGNVYVVDGGNNRVQEFGAGGAFIRAWGLGVVATGQDSGGGAAEFEVCNAVSSPQDVCKAGVAGSVAGGISVPQGIAVEKVTGDVYVTDQGNHRVDEFTEAGAFVRMFGREVNKTKKTNVCSQEEVEKESVECKSGLSGAAAGEFGASIGYPAIDPTTGDVYVADPANRRVEVFEGDGVFKHAFGWGVANGAGEFQVCTSTCQAGVVSASETSLGRFAAGSPTRVAVDASGNVYVVDGGAPDFRVQKFGPVSKENVPLAEFFASAQLTGTSSVTAPTDVAVEPTPLGAVLGAREPSSPAEHLVYELGSGGSLLGTDGVGAALPAPQGLAVGSLGGNVYFSTATGNRVFVLGAIVAPVATIEAVTNPTASGATLHGTIDPEETPPNGIETVWQFEYSPNDVEWTPLSGGTLAASTSPIAVTQTVTGLEGGTSYYVRLHASKEFAAGSATSMTVQFTTSVAAPTVFGEAVTKVAATSARLSAQINPQHLDTTYHFEYDTVPYTTSATHGTSLPVPDADIGEGASDVPVSQEPRDLKPDTTYYYRVVATNSAETTDGPEHAFRTQVTGSAAHVLPDGRAWEMVSPPNKNGAVIDAIGGLIEGGSVIQAAADGGAFTWTASTAIGNEPAGNITFELSQTLSTRGANGWSSRDISPPHDTPAGLRPGNETEYKFFSPNLSLGLIEPIAVSGVTPLSPEATEMTLYLREDMGDDYLPLVTPANTPPGVKIDRSEGENETGLEFEGATPDLSHVVFNGPAGLDSSYPGVGTSYEWAGGKVHLISVLPPPGNEPTDGQLGNKATGDVRHAISNDGSRVVWSGGEGVYMRDMVKGETVLLGAGGTFQTASEDDHKVFFTAGSDLDVFETTSGEDEPLKGELTDLTVDHNVGESAGVEGVLPGASEDGSYVYLVATGVLSEAANSEREKAAPGADNLYVLHDTSVGWTTTFIAQLSGEDAPDWTAKGGGPDRASDLENLTSRVSPDGRYFAFMSDRELTGYDNHDANSGEPDEEVFLYHAPENLATESGALTCASCDPTGARPVGVFDEGPVFPGTGVHAHLLIDEPEIWGRRWLAANIPGWTSAYGVPGLSFYQSRYLSDSGRLFFNSSDALVPQDVNATEDVYEFEPPKVGSCAEGSSTFDAVTGGCVSLISSGTSAGESTFLDASEDGGEVFFLTSAQLVTQDVDTSLDVYDARECTAQSPCVSAPVSPPECTTTDACRAAPTPQPSIFGSPSSATFSGAGNPVSAPMTANVQVKVPLTRAQKLADALKECKKKKAKKKRSACERQTRKQYGAPQKAKKTSRGGK